MTENLSGELFSDWARVVSTTSDSLCFLFQAYCQGLYLRLPKERELASTSFLKGMVLLSEGGNNRWALAPIRPKFQVVSQVSGVKASAFLRFCFLDSPVADYFNRRPAAV